MCVIWRVKCWTRWMRVKYMNLGPFVGVDLSSWPTVYIVYSRYRADTDVKLIKYQTKLIAC